MFLDFDGLNSLQRRKLELKAKFESSLTYYNFKRFIPGAFNMVFIDSTCTALPHNPYPDRHCPSRQSVRRSGCARGPHSMVVENNIWNRVWDSDLTSGYWLIQTLGHSSWWPTEL
jgi:hypothetical protein